MPLLNSKHVDQILDQLAEIARYLKTGKLEDLQVIKVTNVLKQFIDKYIIESNEITAVVLNNEIKNNKRDIDTIVKATPSKELTVDKAYKILYYLKTNLAILITKYSKIFNFYIYSEIKSTISYYITQTQATGLYDDNAMTFNMSQKEYHQQTSMYKYMYSTFDKMMYINVFLSNKFGIGKLGDDKDYKFMQDFAKTSKHFLRDKDSQQRLQEVLDKMWKSSSYHFIRKLRNMLEHSFVNPETKSNLVLPTQMLFILIMRVILEISTDFKRDEEIFSLLVKK